VHGIAQADRHAFLKPDVTRTAARLYGVDFRYESRPSWAATQSIR
jgi:hypothetical protein